MEPTEFVQRIEDLGGKELPDPCQGESLTYSIPMANQPASATVVTRTCHCNERVRYAIPFDSSAGVRVPMDEQGHGRHVAGEADGGARFVTLCAICDSPERAPFNPVPRLARAA